MYSERQLETFIAAYIEAMLWSSTDDYEEPLDRDYDSDDIDDDCHERIKQDCEKFLHLTIDILDDCEHTYLGRYELTELAGHDFWLTRNNHGAGFWDGDWHHEEIDDVGEMLTDIANRFPPIDPYVTDSDTIDIL